MRILIADDHSIVRKGLKQILVEEFPFATIEETGDAEGLVKKALSQDWDIVITDLSMPGRSGLDAISQIKQQHPKLPILILSMYPEEQYAMRVLKSGASGYLSKDMAQEELVNAVKKVLSGKKYITPTLVEKLALQLGQENSGAPHEQLSDREFDVLKLLAAGKSVSEIAALMSLGSTTISTYRARIMDKMSLKSNADLTRYALENKLI